jgi:hypothetical protein
LPVGALRFAPEALFPISVASLLSPPQWQCRRFPLTQLNLRGHRLETLEPHHLFSVTWFLSISPYSSV